MSEQDDSQTYAVVMNHEEQYSIWPADREVPSGWNEVGKEGDKAECLAYIREVWTDMRPLSLRKALEEAAARPAKPSPATSAAPKTDLVSRLEKEQAVEAAVRPEPSVDRLESQLERGYVYVKFVETGTELAIEILRDECDFSKADFAAGTGTMILVGKLSLDFTPVRYQGELDLATLKGKGKLERIQAVTGV